jgi:hypothetical protein
MLKIFFLILILSIKAYSVEDTQQWLNVTVQGSATPVIGYYVESQFRRSEDQDRFFEKFVRPAIFFKTEDSGSFFLGTMKRFDSGDREVETRHWLQYLYPYQNFSFRLRFEQRDLNSLSRNSDRLRLFGRINGQKLYFEKFKPFASLELFHNLNGVSPSIQSGFAQSRTMLGFSSKLGEQLALEASYLNQKLMLPNRPDETNHVMNFVLNVTLK